MTRRGKPLLVPSFARLSRAVRANRLVDRCLAHGRWRRTLPAVIGVLAALLAYDNVLVEFMHTRRQDALVGQFNAQATASTIGFGDAVALLQIPSIGVNVVVGEGESLATLRAGPAHRLTSAMPGTTGNAVISGKRSRYGAPFAKLDQLQPGAEIYVKTRAGVPVRYVVEDVTSGSPDDDALRPSDDGRLTLLTSASRFGRDVVVVSALADASATLERAAAVPVIGARSDDSVSSSDLAVVGLWLIALGVLVWLYRRLPGAFVGVTRWVVLVPVAALSCLQFLLALERLFPATM